MTRLELLHSHYQDSASPDDKTTFLDWIVLAMHVPDASDDVRSLGRKHALGVIRDVYVKRVARLDQMLREQ